MKNYDYYSVYMKHKETGIEIKIDRFEIHCRKLITSEILKLIPKDLRKTDWKVEINKIG